MPDTIEPTRPEPTRPVVAQKPPSAPVTGTDSVVIACKSPNGVVIQGYTKVMRKMPMPGGMVDEETWQRDARTFTVAGPNGVFDPHTSTPVGMRMHPQLARFKEEYGGYAFTEGCPRSLWDQWSHYNEEWAIATGLFAAFDTRDEAIIWAKEGRQKDLRSGQEPIDPEHPELTTGTGYRNALGGVTGVRATTADT